MKQIVQLLQSVRHNLSRCSKPGESITVFDALTPHHLSASCRLAVSQAQQSPDLATLQAQVSRGDTLRDSIATLIQEGWTDPNATSHDTAGAVLDHVLRAIAAKGDIQATGGILDLRCR